MLSAFCGSPHTESLKGSDDGYSPPCFKKRASISAGKLEKDEDPFEAAKRELEEECGVTAERFINLGVLYPTVGYDSEKIYIWAAKGLKPTSQHLDDGEFLDVAGLPFDDVLQMVMTDEIRDSKTVTAMLKYAWLRQRGEG